jgi:hypothetical protein
MFSNYKIYRDDVFDNIQVTDLEVEGGELLPSINSIAPPQSLRPGIGGDIAYDMVTKRVYYNNGSVWLPISVGGGVGGNSQSFSFIKNGNQNIVANTATIVTNWTDPVPYSTLPSWNLATGIYIAPQNQFMSINADIAWAGGISNLGTRFTRIMYNNAMTSTTIIAKEVITQADPATNIETTQQATINLALDAGDSVWVTVQHDAPLSIPFLTLASGNHNSICGTVISA